MIILDHSTAGRVPDGMAAQRAPMAPGGYALRCLTCGCTTGRHHTPGSEHCRTMIEEARHG